MSFSRALGAQLIRRPTAEEILANAENLTELKTTSTVTHGGFTRTYSIETDSNDPAEIAQFKAIHWDGVICSMDPFY